MGNGKWKGAYKVVSFFTTIIVIIGLSFMLVIKDKSNNEIYEEKKEEANILSFKGVEDYEDIKIEESYGNNDENIEREIITGLSDYKRYEKSHEVISSSYEDENDDDILRCYLTFDDGPSLNITPQILDVLKKENVKATFFVIGSLAEENSDIVKRAFDEGHYIANHTYSHRYKEVYSSKEFFIEEVKMGEKIIENITGNKTKLFRFPGGSFGKDEYIGILESHGYEHIDWNSLNGDAEALNVSKSTMMKKLKESMYGQNPLIVLMHDAATKQTTVNALPEIIGYIREQGYEFSTMEKWTSE